VPVALTQGTTMRGSGFLEDNKRKRYKEIRLVKSLYRVRHSDQGWRNGLGKTGATIARNGEACPLEVVFNLHKGKIWIGSKFTL